MRNRALHRRVKRPPHRGRGEPGGKQARRGVVDFGTAGEDGGNGGVAFAELAATAPPARRADARPNRELSFRGFCGGSHSPQLPPLVATKATLLILRRAVVPACFARLRKSSLTAPSADFRNKPRDLYSTSLALANTTGVSHSTSPFTRST